MEGWVGRCSRTKWGCGWLGIKARRNEAIETARIRRVSWEMNHETPHRDERRPLDLGDRRVRV